MLKTNENNLVMMSVSGKVSQSESHGGFLFDSNGRPFSCPGTGGICYNVVVGNSAFGWAGDHIEPGVSSKGSEHQNASYNFLSCIGNEVVVVSGDAKGEVGIVTGMHGGSDRVMIDFPKDVMFKLTHDDTFMVRTFGQGLSLDEFPDIRMANICPNLLAKLPIIEKNGKLFVGVTKHIPSELMGSGIGSLNISVGDYDITTQDEDLVNKLNINKIRLGDVVALIDQDGTHGRTHRTGAITIGIVVHSDSKLSGHGPGVTTIISSRDSTIIPFYDGHANIAEIMKIGAFRNETG